VIRWFLVNTLPAIAFTISVKHLIGVESLLKVVGAIWDADAVGFF
jgi:hypothetical protein